MTSRGPDATRHPILGPCLRVFETARDVGVVESALSHVAGWMSGEELPWPDFRSPFIPSEDNFDTIDFVFLTAAMNFAFTDFASGHVFQVQREGRWRSDSDAMMTCLKEALEEGIPILEGNWLRSVGLRELETIFQGSIRMPMLDERLRVLNEIGSTLDLRWSGRFHQFLAAAAVPGRATPSELLPRFAVEFPSFADVRSYHGIRIPFLKRAQLFLWQAHCRFRTSGLFRLEGPGQLTAFADYIVPMALHSLGVLSYSDDLGEAIQGGRHIPAGSDWEIEIRAGSIVACHLLTDAINELRPPESAIIEPVLDARLWTHYHASHLRHHLTMTTDY